jgi:TRAP transporter 4TM/12TM fusion protein
LIILILFVSIMQICGAGDWFLNLAIRLAGRYIGGAAKIEVISSAFLGTIEGSPIANVVGTGSFTIPLMKRTGYPPYLAGAIEAASSSGAMIMPPIMGVTAFLMADYLGVPYIKVCVAAIIPAIIYFFAMFMRVHLEAKRLNLGKVPEEEIAKLSLIKLMREGFFFLIPLIVLIFFLAEQYGMAKCAAYAFIATLIVSIIKPKDRLTPDNLLIALSEGIRGAIPVAVACAAAGMIIGSFYASGISERLIESVVEISRGYVFIASILTAAVAILMGMAMPAIPVYITLAITLVPVLTHMNVNPIAAHFFCFFWGVISNVTPPVALAAYVAAGIARAPVMKTAFAAASLALPSMIMMLTLPKTPELLGIGSPSHVAVVLAAGLAVGIAIPAAISGYFKSRLRLWQRALLLALGLSFLWPDYFIRLFGTVTIGIILSVLLFAQRTKT